MRRFDTEGLALVLRGRRKMRALDLRSAAKDIGVSAATLNRAEQGHEVELQTAVVICEWLELPLDSFVRGGEPNGKAGRQP